MKFKKAMLTEPHKMEIFEVEEVAGKGQALIKIASCGMCNWELNFWHGNLNFFGYPHKLGHEYSGVVVEVGEGCTKLKVGDRVSSIEGLGGFAEYCVVSEDSCELLEDHVDIKYAMGEPQKCILTVLEAANPRPADFGIVQGCGPMGMWCIQALAGNMLSALIAIDIDDEKLQLAKQFGATHVINSKTQDVETMVREITKGHLADFVIEGTGVPVLLDRAQDLVKNGREGRIIMMSSHHEPVKEFDFRKAVAKGITIIAAHPPYSKDEKDDFRRAVNYINNGTFKNKELISHEFALEDIQTAFETLADKPAGFMKAIVVP